MGHKGRLLTRGGKPGHDEMDGPASQAAHPLGPLAGELVPHLYTSSRVWKIKLTEIARNAQC